MARIHGCHVTSREEMLFMKYEHFGKCKGSFKVKKYKKDNSWIFWIFCYCTVSILLYQRV